MLAQELSDAEITEACSAEPSVVCRWVAETLNSASAGRLADLLVNRPARILIILLVAWVMARILRRLVTRVGARVVQDRIDRRGAHPPPSNVLGPVGRQLMAESSRSELRITTLAGVLASLAGFAVWSVAVLTVLGEFDVNLAPLLAGAGVVGVALGFGAQSIVADFLSGSFMLLEDQYGVGDVIDVGEATGTVEDFSLRTTTLRDVNGTVWHLPNSEIRRVANKSQFWSRAVLDIEVAYDTDLRRAEGIIQRVADDLWQDVDFQGGTIIDPPEVWGIERLGANGISIRLVVKTDPAEQWSVARELRLRIKEALEQADIEIPFPQQVVWIRNDESVVPRAQRQPVPIAEPRLPAITEEMSLNPDLFD